MHRARAVPSARFPRTDRVYDRIRRAYLTADLRSLAAGRIVLALVLLRDLFRRWAELGVWYTNDGIIPNHTLLWRPSWDHVFSLFYLASYSHEAVFGFVICLIVYLCLLVGFRTSWRRSWRSSACSACTAARCCSTTAATWCSGC